MPIYEYRCGGCGWQQEILQKMSDAPLKVCPECGKASVSKMVTAAGFQLKGSGWYATDFKGGAKPAAKADDQPAAKADDKATATAEAKPAAKDQPATEAPARKAEVAAPAATTTGNPAGS